jgi:hypothetical protein
MTEDNKWSSSITHACSYEDSEPGYCGQRQNDISLESDKTVTRQNFRGNKKLSQEMWKSLS